MDKFIVSARKYRPQTFSSVIGQDHITTTLKNAIKNNQLAHAFLFCGPRGVGKTTCARILAKAMNCTNIGKDGDPCNNCIQCKSFDDGSSVNIYEMDAASNNSVEDIRQLVEQVRFAPNSGEYKIYIIDEVHMLTNAAFNAFLKTLEEPPPYAVFILATTERYKLLPTILSRCQIFDFRRIVSKDTVNFLLEITGKEKIKTDPAALSIIAQKSDGCMRDALSILDKLVSFSGGQLTYESTIKHLNIIDTDYFFKTVELLKNQDVTETMLLYDDVNRKGFDGFTVLEGMIEFVRNLLMSKDAKTHCLLDMDESLMKKVIATGEEFSVAWLVSAMNVLSECASGYNAARNKRFHIELALIKLAYLRQAIAQSRVEVK